MPNPFNIEENLLHLSKFATTQDLHGLRRLSESFYKVFCPFYYDKRNLRLNMDLETLGYVENIKELPHIYRSLDLNQNIFCLERSEISKVTSSLELVAPYIQKLYLDIRYHNPHIGMETETFVNTIQNLKNLKACTMYKFKWDESLDVLVCITKCLKDMKVKDIKLKWRKGVPADFPKVALALEKLNSTITRFDVNCKHAYGISSVDALELVNEIVQARGGQDLEFEGIRLFIQGNNFPDHCIQDLAKVLNNIGPCIKSISFQILRYNPAEWAVFPVLQSPINWTKLVSLKIHGCYEHSFRFINEFPNLKNLYLINLNWNNCLFPNKEITDRDNLKEIFDQGSKLDKLFIFHGRIFSMVPLNGFNRLNEFVTNYLKTIINDVKVTTCIIDLPHNI